MSHKKENYLILLLAVVIGVAMGWVAVGFNQAVIYGVQWIRPLLNDHRIMFFLLPLAGFVLVSLLNKMGLYDIEYGFGVGQVLAELRNIKKQIIRPMTLVLDVIASLITLVFGFSAGRFGPIVHLGASVGSTIGYRLNLNAESIRLLIGCGIGGTIASVFGLPFFAVVFVAEVVFREAIYRNIAPLLLTTYASYSMSTFLGFKEPLLPVVGDYSTFFWSYKEWGFVLGMAIFISLISVLYIWTLEKSAFIMKKIKCQTFRFLVAAICVGIGAYILPLQMDLHNESLSRVLSGELTMLTLVLFLVFHLILTGVTLGSGYIGGNFFPGVAIGAASSMLYTHVMMDYFKVNCDYKHIGVLGVCTMIGSFLNAPLSAIALCIELTQSTSFVLPMVLMVSVAGSISQLILKRDVFTATVERITRKLKQ